MLLLASTSWAATVPGTHSSVIAACQDTSVDTIEVLSGAELGNGVCQVKRPLLVKSSSGERVPPMAVSNGGDLVLEGVEILVTGSDPAVQATEAPVTLVDVHLEFVAGSGDAIYGWDTTVLLDQVLIEGFTQSTPVRLFAFQAPLALEIKDSEVSSNTFKAAYISGVYGYPITVDVTGSAFSNNASSDSYGPFEVQGDVTVVLKDTVFDSNAGQVGGALHLGEGSSLTVVGGSFLSNTSGDDGGAIYSFGAPVSLEGVDFERNSAAAHGGAVNADNGASVTVIGGTFIGNEAKKGGAIQAGGGLDIDGSYFCQNTATTGGAAVWMQASDAQVRYAVFQDHRGTALEGSGMGTEALVHVSFIGNDTGFDAGTTDLSVIHSLFWGNDVSFVNSATYAGYTTNGFDDAPGYIGTDELVFEDAGFAAAFATEWGAGECGALPYLRADSALIGQAGDGYQIGALGPDEDGPHDSGVTVDSGVEVDSGGTTDSPPTDSTASDSGRLDSAVPDPIEPVTWVSGGCRGPVSAFLLAGILLLSRTFRTRAD